LEGQPGWRAVFPNEKHKFRRPAQKGSPASFSTAHQPAFMCSSLARPVLQPAGPAFCAACQPVENSCYSFGNTALQPARPSV